MRKVLLLLVVAVAFGCETKEEKLPIYGLSDVNDAGDTIYHQVADFSFLNQDSVLITQKAVEDKIYVADFFFTTGPTICPVMKTQMLRVYEKYEHNPDVLILSHSIDPKHDSVAVLREFAERLGVSSDKWHFMTGDKDKTFKLGQTSYMVTTMDDPTAPGGLLHSGAFILVDKSRRVRGVYDGTDEEAVTRLLADMDKLLNEYAK